MADPFFHRCPFGLLLAKDSSMPPPFVPEVGIDRDYQSTRSYAVTPHMAASTTLPPLDALMQGWDRDF
jgi:hypothetical protein